MNSTIIGGAMLPHAPQFFTQPETEDKATIAAVQEVGGADRRGAAGAGAGSVDHLFQ